jgi:hypothetical protein
VPSGNLFSSAASQAGGVLGLRWRLFDFARIDAQIDQLGAATRTPAIPQYCRSQQQ